MVNSITYAVAKLNATARLTATESEFVVRYKNKIKSCFFGRNHRENQIARLENERRDKRD